jgi:hypothetical protein
VSQAPAHLLAHVGEQTELVTHVDASNSGGGIVSENDNELSDRLLAQWRETELLM